MERTVSVEYCVNIISVLVAVSWNILSLIHFRQLPLVNETEHRSHIDVCMYILWLGVGQEQCNINTHANIFMFTVNTVGYMQLPWLNLHLTKFTSYHFKNNWWILLFKFMKWLYMIDYLLENNAVWGLIFHFVNLIDSLQLISDHSASLEFHKMLSSLVRCNIC